MILTHKQKLAVKKFLSPLYRIASGSKRIETRYNYVEFGKRGCHTYFGYYDVTPFQGEKVIYIERKGGGNGCRVVLNDIHNGSKQYLADSHVCNWQQGIRLRWFPMTENVISFNDYVDGRYINRIINIETKDEKRVDWPLYDIDPKGGLGLTLDFERLGVMHPGYGYTNRPYMAGDLWQDGISIIDIEKNQLVRKITYKEHSCNIKKAYDISRFYLSHLNFSPDGTKFLFFWIDEDEGFNQASLGVYDILNNQLIPLETEGKASHFVWDGNDEIICTVLNKKYKAGYYRFNIKERTKKQICPKSLTNDGHPSIYAEGMLLTDSYPDKRGFQHIYLVDENKDTKTEVLKIYSVPKLKTEKRTDLHPRLSSDRRFISLDSNHDGHRKMLVIELGK